MAESFHVFRLQANSFHGWNEHWMMNRKECGSKTLWPNLRHYIDTFLEGLKKIMKMSVTLTGCLLSICNCNLPNVKQKSYVLDREAWWHSVDRMKINNLGLNGFSSVNTQYENKWMRKMWFLTTVTTINTVFWDLTPCSLV